MGCPVKKVVGTGAGSALLRDPAKVAGIVREVRRATSLPFTVKIRTGWTCEDHSFLEIGRIAQEEGCDAVTLHPRSRSQMFEGKADWSRIAELKQALSIPVIGSGDLFSAHDVVRMLEETGCDAVMIARGAMGNPWIFREALELLEGRTPVEPSREERYAVSLRHLELFSALAGERTALLEMRKHLSWYSKGLPGSAQFRATVNAIENNDQLIAAMENFFHG
jgi:nifR3 family TIM-barrel protein